MANYYNDDRNEDLNEISPDVAHELVGCNIPTCYPGHFDKLTAGEFKDCVTFIMKTRVEATVVLHLTAKAKSGSFITMHY